MAIAFSLWVSLVSFSDGKSRVRIELLQSQGVVESPVLELSEAEFGKWKRDSEICCDMNESFKSTYSLADESYDKRTRTLGIVSLGKTLGINGNMSMSDCIKTIRLAIQKYEPAYKWNLVKSDETSAIIINEVDYEKIREKNLSVPPAEFIVSRIFKGEKGFFKIEYAERKRHKKYSQKKIVSILKNAYLVKNDQPVNYDKDIENGCISNLLGTGVNFHHNKYFTVHFFDNEKWIHRPCLSSHDQCKTCYFPEKFRDEEIPSKRIWIMTDKNEFCQNSSMGEIFQITCDTLAEEAESAKQGISTRIVEISNVNALVVFTKLDRLTNLPVSTEIHRIAKRNDHVLRFVYAEEHPDPNLKDLGYWIALTKHARVTGE